MTDSRRSFVLSLGAALAGGRLAAQGQADFLTDLTEHERIETALPEYLKKLAHERLAERKRIVSAMRTPADVAERKAYIRRIIEEAVGGFPERTPLNPRVVGTIERDGYKIEKIVFESQPKFYVTANLYLPTSGADPYPGVL